VPLSAHGTVSFGGPTSASSRIVGAVLCLFDRIVDRKLTARALNLSAIRLSPEDEYPLQYDMFNDYAFQKRERELQRSMISMHQKYGKNSILRGHDLLEGATLMERNTQIGGHKAT